ncbi:MAG TPA: hypothetical protein VJJ22_04270 [Candidatus Paceibacterota bacterium]
MTKWTTYIEWSNHDRADRDANEVKHNGKSNARAYLLSEILELRRKGYVIVAAELRGPKGKKESLLQ